MVNLKDEILKVANGQKIEAIVIGEHAGDEDSKCQPYFGRILKWEDAIRIVDYKYDNGFGAEDCHAVIAWTEDYVIFISCYDGSTSVQSVPRHPTEHEPIMYGGG